MFQANPAILTFPACSFADEVRKDNILLASLHFKHTSGGGSKFLPPRLLLVPESGELMAGLLQLFLQFLVRAILRFFHLVQDIKTEGSFPLGIQRPHARRITQIELLAQLVILVKLLLNLPYIVYLFVRVALAILEV